MTSIRLLLLSLFCLTLAACQPSEDSGPATEMPVESSAVEAEVEVADRILTSGTVITVDADRPAAEAIAIKDGRVLAVGSADEIAGHAGDGTEIT